MRCSVELVTKGMAHGDLRHDFKYNARIYTYGVFIVNCWLSTKQVPYIHVLLKQPIFDSSEITNISLCVNF